MILECLVNGQKQHVYIFIGMFLEPALLALLYKDLRFVVNLVNCSNSDNFQTIVRRTFSTSDLRPAVSERTPYIHYIMLSHVSHALRFLHLLLVTFFCFMHTLKRWKKVLSVFCIYESPMFHKKTVLQFMCITLCVRMKKYFHIICFLENT